MNEKVSMLKEKAKELRKTALTMIFEAQSGHPGRFAVVSRHRDGPVFFRNAR